MPTGSGDNRAEGNARLVQLGAEFVSVCLPHRDLIHAVLPLGIGAEGEDSLLVPKQPVPRSCVVHQIRGRSPIDLLNYGVLSSVTPVTNSIKALMLVETHGIEYVVSELAEGCLVRGAGASEGLLERKVLFRVGREESEGFRRSGLPGLVSPDASGDR